MSASTRTPIGPADLKKLQTRHSDARRLVDAARSDFRRASDNLTKAEKELKDAGTALVEAQKQFVVSEHALLRHCERVLGIDTAGITADLTAELEPMVSALGDGRYPLNKSAPGFVAIVRNKTVVTIEPA